MAFGLAAAVMSPVFTALLSSWGYETTNLALGYQYELQQFFSLNLLMEWIQTIFPADGSLDAPPYDTADMDVDPILANVSMDSIVQVASKPVGLWQKTGTTSHEVFTLNGSLFLQGILVLGERSAMEGRRALLRYVRPINKLELGDIAIQVYAKNNPQETRLWSAAKEANTAGVVPTRVAGRYMNLRLFTSGDITKLQGVDVEMSPLGTR